MDSVTVSSKGQIASTASRNRVGGIERIFEQVVSKLPEDVILRRWPDNVFHEVFFRS